MHDTQRAILTALRKHVKLLQCASWFYAKARSYKTDNWASAPWPCLMPAQPVAPAAHQRTWCLTRRGALAHVSARGIPPRTPLMDNLEAEARVSYRWHPGSYLLETGAGVEYGGTRPARRPQERGRKGYDRLEHLDTAPAPHAGRVSGVRELEPRDSLHGVPATLHRSGGTSENGRHARGCVFTLNI
ncbi:hypothetical protein EVG20_g2442 [Dentipellis fragilis]|uniref:Uncharacterized protein n=1 Tax=Dentipellis fragilis TaxID=205917 RepID=A0A4Y9Z743_9AGAM|nr:hypothetical protein EVG20_g2442 [Dentipellis fragilis]